MGLKSKKIFITIAFVFLSLYIQGQCTAPSYSCANTTLTTIPFPSVPPKVGSHTCSAGSLTSCGNLTGAGTTFTDPDFKTHIMRASDANTEALKLNASFSVSGAGSGDESHWNCNNDRLIISDDGGRAFVEQFVWGQRLAPMYVGTTYPRGLFTVSGEFFFGHNCSTPYRAYSQGNGVGGSAGAFGSKLGYFDTTNPGAAAPSFTQIADFTSSSHCLGNSFNVTWVTGGESDQTDTDFAVGFSNNGGQEGPGAIYVAVYRVGSGCRVLNISTLTVDGDWGPTGAITGTTCNTATIHNVKIFKAGGSSGAIEVSPANGCVDAHSSGYVWFYTGLTYQPQCTTNCSGHQTEGLSAFVNQAGNTPASAYWAKRQNNAAGTFTALVPALPTDGYPNADWHCGWNSLNDSYPFICSTNIPGGGTITHGWEQEIIGIDPSGTKNPIRFAHTFNTALSANFGTTIADGSISQDGRYYAYSSDHLGTLGNTSGSSSCTITTTCRGDVFVADLTSGTFAVPAQVFSSGFNKSNSPWCPVDGNNVKAQIYGYRMWDAGVKWSQIQSTNTTPTFTTMDTLVNSRARNVASGCPGTPLKMIYTFGGTPAWASACAGQADPSTCLPGPSGSGYGGGQQCNGPTDYGCLPPGDINTDGTGADTNYVSLAVAIAQRYTGKIAYYEIWNEPYTPGFWCIQGGTVPCGGQNPNTIVNAQALKIMIRMAWDLKHVINCIDPAAKIISPTTNAVSALTWFHNYNISSISAPAGVSGVNGVPVGCNWNAQTVTGAQTYDYVNFHGYGTNAVSPDPAGNWSPEALTIAWTNVQTEIANDSLPNPGTVLNTEFGYNTVALVNNVDYRASFIARSYTLCASLGISQCYWYQWDTTTYGPSSTLPGTAYNTIANWLIGATVTSQCANTTGSIWQCGFISNTGTAEQVAWDASQNCNSGCTTANFSFGSSYSKYTDITGVVRASTGGNGTVPLGLKPVLVQADASGTNVGQPQTQDQ